ncbi:MAG: beta-propeller domain-containing protein [Rhodoferax sp.]|jgi:hypothetical protein|nr:beta-propeller domain-containing protein [Rhodoferax sp.]
MARKHVFSTRLLTGALARMLGLSILTVAALAGCGGGSGGVSTSSGEPTPAPAPWSLRPATEAGLTSYFRQALGPSSKNYIGSIWAMDFPVAVENTTVPAATPGAAPGVAGSVFSGTMLQESGVDEADLIKSDGTHVFSLDPGTTTGPSRDMLRRQQFNPAATDARLLPVDNFKLTFSTDVRGTGLYLDAGHKQLAVIAEGVADRATYDAWFAPQAWSQGVTEVALIDTASPTQMQQRRLLRMTAQLIGSRRLGATLYLVLRSYPQVPGLDPAWPTAKTAANQALLDTLQASQLLPTLSIDGGAAQPLVQAESCFTQDNNAVQSADIITLVAIDLAASTHQHAARCFAGGTEAFYMSEQSLYLASTRSAYSYSGAMPVYAAQSSIDVHKFALSGLDMAYRGSGNVSGHLGFDQNRKSFRLGEYQGALRVITQTATSWGGWIALPALPAVVADVPTAGPDPAATAPVESPARLSILQESAGTLALVGELPNARHPEPLGKPGEQLYATRFVGARGFLVTYRLTDPLYVLNLADPADPRVAGELQVSGYSDYLFPLTDTLLLGVGKDAVSDNSAGDGRFAWYQGVKLALIDVSDPSRPREAARSIIGRRGTDATVLHDHHGIALQTLGNTVRLSMPVSLHDTPADYNTGSVSDYFGFTRTELQTFEIDLSAATLSVRLPLAASVPGERDIGADRSLLWNNQLHYYQNGTWDSVPW